MGAKQTGCLDAGKPVDTAKRLAALDRQQLSQQTVVNWRYETPVVIQ
jgi:hypothetical protein